MAALLLADRAVTLIPAPAWAEGREDLQQAAADVPRYRMLVDRLSWCAPLFRAGVIGSEVEGEDAIDDVRDTWGRIESEDDWAPLRPWMKWALPEEPERFLDALCGDMLKGGPDPGISVPIAAGIDRFSGRMGLIVARSHPTSLAQRAEAAFARSLCSWAMPVLVQATAERMELAREVLEDALADLRESVDALLEARHHGTPDPRPVRDAAEQVGRMFAENLGDLTSDEGDEVRPVTGSATLSLVRLPVDAALRSSADAAAAMGPAAGRRAHRPGPLDDSSGVIALVVKVLGRDGSRRPSPGARAWSE